jgi:glycosyltransferase involved in cell wall biosynthesis
MSTFLMKHQEVPTEATVQDNNCGPEHKNVPIEFLGWLPIFRLSGNCGNHPQFGHTKAPPEGYQFIRSQLKLYPNTSFAARMWGRLIGWGRVFCWKLYLTLRPVKTLFDFSFAFGPKKVLWTFWAMTRLFFVLMWRGGSFRPVMYFLRTRHFASQVRVPWRSNLLFLTSVPFTYNQHPWVVEVEDWTTLFLPFIHNGKTEYLRLHENAYFPVVRALLETKKCRGIITHMRSTANCLKNIFKSDVIREKVFYIPYGVELPSVWQRHEDDETINLLFTGSWHQATRSFFLRGGLDILEAFAVLKCRYPQIRLTIRSGMPKLKTRYRKIIDECDVRIIDGFIPHEEMAALMQRTHLFLLPAARIHIVSVLKAMSYGQVPVCSDGWGFHEYIEPDRNGVLIPGRYGQVSWEDAETGLLREDYRTLYAPNPGVIEKLVEAVSLLVEDHNLRRRLGRKARADVETKFNLQNWNHGLKATLDKALASN